MWQRVVEVMLALWLAISPFVFRVDDAAIATWVIDFGAAALVALFSLAAFWTPLRRANFGTMAVGLFLVGYGWLQGRPLPPPEQNHMMVGLLLFMFALIPSECMQPPPGWREPEPD